MNEIPDDVEISKTSNQISKAIDEITNNAIPNISCDMSGEVSTKGGDERSGNDTFVFDTDNDAFDWLNHKRDRLPVTAKN